MAHPSARTTSLKLVKEEGGVTTISVAVKVSRGIDEIKELSRMRPLSVECVVSSFCDLRE